MNALLIGNGWFDPKLQYPTYWDFAAKQNTYLTPLVDNHQKIKAWHDDAYGKCKDLLVKCYETGQNQDCIAADGYCYSHAEYPFDKLSGRDEYDMVRVPLRSI